MTRVSRRGCTASGSWRRRGGGGLVALVCALAAGCGTDAPRDAPPRGPATSRFDAQIAAFRREVRAPGARLATTRTTWGAFTRRVGAPSAPDPGRAVVAVTLTGRVDLRTAAAPDPADRRVTGRYAFLVLDARTGERLGLGVLPRAP